MPAATITCPRCSKTLTRPRSMAAGARLRCPKCGASFAAQSEDVPAPDPGERTQRGPPDEEPVQRSRGWRPLLAVVGVVLLLLLGAGVVLAVVLALRGNTHPAAAAVAGSPDDKNEPVQPDQSPPERPPFNSDADPEPPAQAWLPPEEQEKVNAAIERGVEFLKKEQQAGGRWPDENKVRPHAVGMSALAGLTLLECGVPADDPQIQQAAGFVRRTAPQFLCDATYELSLAILFLDRLGDPQDEPLIRTMALRLIAGQTAAGGWTYGCPPVSEKDERSLLTILETTRPRSSLDLVASKPGDNHLDDLFTGRVGGTPPPPVVGSTIPLPDGPSADELKRAKLMYDGLSPALKASPALKPPTADDQMPRGDLSDNSNTQFATLGLWAAGRHGVPMARSLSLLARRFQVTQTRNGGWDYSYHNGAGGMHGMEQQAMTGAGLLGLAVGHGVTADLTGTDVESAGEDPLVEQGMTCLSGFIGRSHNLYFLWTVERVGMLYNRRTIADKEWYPSGAEFLLKNQQGDGSWRVGGYTGASVLPDTCFGLLFLKRANLVKDLTNKVQFLTRVQKKDGDR